MNRRRNRTSAQAGFSMLEVLVSLIVLSIGLISVAGATYRSLGAADSSGHRAIAAREALAMADLIRANAAGALDGKYNTAFGGGQSGSGREALALKHWKDELKVLPQGDGSISVDPISNNVKISVRWEDGRGDAVKTNSSNVQTYAYNFPLGWN